MSIKESDRKAVAVRKAARQRCRHDLLFLCNVILGYKDVNRQVHGPIIDILQQFPKTEEGGHDIEVSLGKFDYKPAKEIWQLEGNRERLILYPRGHLKTTLVTQAHLIQWIINYPDIRILLSCYTGDQVEKVMRAIKGVFQYNEDFRTIFPDFCPPKDKASDFGSRDQFITPARKLVRGEPTVFSVTVGKTIAGYHPDVIFHSDLVDKENVKTPGGITDVIDHFKYMNPLLERYDARDGFPASRGFTYVEGTPYDFGDLHNFLINTAWAAPSATIVKSAAEPYPPRSEADILWPGRFPAEELEKIRKEMGDWMFSAQYLMKCIPDGDGLCDPKDVIFLPADEMHKAIGDLSLHCAVDLAGMESDSKTSDDTAISIGGFSRTGRLHILEIFAKRYATEEVIELMFHIHRKYPKLRYFKVEKEAHARVLLPFLQREMSRRNTYLTIMPIQRDNSTSKKHRIRGLRPWFRNNSIFFSDAIPLTIKQKLLDQISQFPSESAGVHDDVLDTLADLMRDGENDSGVTYDIVADAAQPDMRFAQFGQPMPQDRFMGFGEGGVPNWLYGPEWELTKQRHPTGIM